MMDDGFYTKNDERSTENDDIESTSSQCLLQLNPHGVLSLMDLLL